MEALRGVVEGMGVAAANGPQHEALHRCAKATTAHVHVCHLQCTAGRLMKVGVDVSQAVSGVGCL